MRTTRRIRFWARLTEVLLLIALTFGATPTVRATLAAPDHTQLISPER